MAVALNTYDLDARLLRSVYELDTKRDFLRSAYRLEEVRAELRLTEDAAERACDFWVRDGALQYSPSGHLSLTYLGARRAESLEQGGWSLADL